MSMIDFDLCNMTHDSVRFYTSMLLEVAQLMMIHSSLSRLLTPSSRTDASATLDFLYIKNSYIFL